MKAQFKYAFITGSYIRGITFVTIFVMNTVFIILGSLGLLPFAALVTAVSLGGVAIAVMMITNIISDIYILKRMFSVPEAYLYALTPVPRGKILFASIITVTIMDLFTMAVVIFQEVWLSFNLTSLYVGQIFWNMILENLPSFGYFFWSILLIVSGYLLVLMVILFCITAKKSLFFKMPASGLMTFLLAIGCWYAISFSHILLIPFGIVERSGLIFTISITSSAAFPALTLLNLLQAAALFVITSKLMERKINL